MKISLLFVLLAAAFTARSQQLSIPDLYGMLDWQHFRIDTTLKKQGYLLMQKEVDSASSIYQYSHLDRQEEAPTTVRSFVYMDVKAGDVSSRLITYRTYSEEEYVKMAKWLLENNYHTKDKFDFGDSKHTLYTNGKETIRIKVITTRLEAGKVFTSYEVELGK